MFAAAGASRCAPGFYALKGSRRLCQQCPYGRTTANDVALQRLFTDCIVKPGFGLVSSTRTTTDGTGYIGNATDLPDDVAAVMTALECPIGFYGAGSTIRSTCSKCPDGSSTEDIARTDESMCSGRSCDSCVCVLSCACACWHMSAACHPFNNGVLAVACYGAVYDPYHLIWHQSQATRQQNKPFYSPLLGTRPLVG